MATDHVTDLKLGITQEEFLKKTETHLETLYEQNVAQGTAITSAQTKAEEAIAAAQGKTKGIVYANLSAMVTGLRSKARTDLNVGDNIYITAIDVPDFWVADVPDSQNVSNDENTLIINNYNNTHIGYFVISKLETQKAVITNMVETDNDITANQIVFGAGNRKVKGSGYTITETAPSEDSNHTSVPTSKAVYDAVEGAVANVHSHSNKDILDKTTASFTTAAATKLAGIEANANNYAHPSNYTEKTTSGLYKMTVDKYGHVTAGDEVGEATESASGLMSATDKQKLNAIDDSLKGVTADEIGKVQDVQVDGVSVLKDGIANIDISDISVDVEELEANYVPVTPQAVTLNGKAYKAIVVKETDVSLEVLNSEGKAVVTQVIRANDNIYYCLPSTDTNTYTLRKVGGNAVGGGSSKLVTIATSGLSGFTISDVNRTDGLNKKHTAIITNAEEIERALATEGFLRFVLWINTMDRRCVKTQQLSLTYENSNVIKNRLFADGIIALDYYNINVKIELPILNGNTRYIDVYSSEDLGFSGNPYIEIQAVC